MVFCCEWIDGERLGRLQPCFYASLDAVFLLPERDWHRFLLASEATKNPMCLIEKSTVA
jgi:hypothetical protein